MIVFIDDSVFDSGACSALTLMAIFEAANAGKHRLQVLPPWNEEADSAVNRWLMAQSGALAQELRLALKYGLTVEARSFECEVRLRIRRFPAEGARVQEVTPERGLELLKTPFEVLVEHFENDWCFFKMMARKWADAILPLEERGLLKPRHGGGDSLLPQVEKLEPLRSFVLFDSDAKLPADPCVPPTPSDWSQSVLQACQNRAISCHQLSRRAAENYIPCQVLEGWTAVSSKKKRATCRSFVTMTPRQRHHYPMREGFFKDRRNPSLGYGDFLHMEELQHGFGVEVRDLFLERQHQIRQDWIERECGEEAQELAFKLLRRL